jgi:hypothetical protein
VVKRRADLSKSADGMIRTFADRRNVFSKGKIRFKGYTKIASRSRWVKEAIRKG